MFFKSLTRLRKIRGSSIQWAISMKQLERLPKVSVKTSRQWALSETSIQSCLAMEVDLVVLSRELYKLGDLSSRIVNSLRELRVSELEQESNMEVVPEYEVE